MLQIELKWPPSVNHMYLRTRSKIIQKPEVVRYKQETRALLYGRKDLPMEGKLSVLIEVYPPDHRRRDIDNVSKVTLDSLQYAGVYRDDYQIDDLRIIRREVVKDGKLIVTIEQKDLENV